MKFSYEELISGDSIPVKGVGSIRSPYLWELLPKKGIGMWNYHLYLNLLAWDKEKCIDTLKGVSPSVAKKMCDNDKFNVFDAMTLVNNFRELLRTAMAFFMDEELVWENDKFRFKALDKETTQVVGYIDRNNFEEVRDDMLQVNYIGLGKSANPTKFTSAKAKELWERAQSYLKASVTTSKAQDKKLEMGNIISKLCASSSGYTLLNIYNLTVFQLYDQFFQYGYLRGRGLSEMAFSIHGGKDFDYEEWLRPLLDF